MSTENGGNTFLQNTHPQHSAETQKKTIGWHSWPLLFCCFCFCCCCRRHCPSERMFVTKAATL